ncbi:MAG TPA: cellulase family glycosylhydrolase [Mycobacteriales bacterium]|nr:cellulase family glycosylhydrolase [Mycobacteriales bacterium]
MAAALGSLALATALAGATLATAAPQLDSARAAVRQPLAIPRQPIGHAGRWLTDAKGRVLLIHGINVSMKGSLAQDEAYHFGADDAAYLAANGFNAVRLTVERYDVEPTPGHFDAAYLSFIQHIVATLARYHVLTLVDFHQDEFGPVFGDNGYPAWMTQTGGSPNLKSVGFPFQYLANPAVNHAFDTLWGNGNDIRGKPLWTDDAQILARVVGSLKSTPGVLGFEIINEPWPGTKYATCLPLVIGCPSFDTGAFSAYYATMDKAIRTQNSTHLVFYEPLVTFNYGIPTSVVPPPGDARLGFSFHDYPLCSAADDVGLGGALDTACGVESKLAIGNAVTYATAHKTALLETEFGATKNAAAINQSTAAYDARMVPWMFWSYDELVGTTSIGAFSSPPSRSPNRAVLDGLARPYPQLVAGTPTSYGYSPKTHVFFATYSTSHVSGSGRFPGNSVSQFEIPRAAYPHGYKVSVKGGAVVSGSGDSLLLVASSGASTVTVTVSPS